MERAAGGQTAWDARADRMIRLIETGVTAFVVASDDAAYTLIRSLTRKGVRVPQDV